MSTTVLEVFGIYNANGGLFGELAYVFGKLRGTTHCALCDITHSGIREKAAFKDCKRELPFPLHTPHINEQSAALAAFTSGKHPCVVARTASGFVMLLDADQLEACRADVGEFRAALEAALHDAKLVVG